jgi:ubiquinone biosynthesis protein COQ9
MGNRAGAPMGKKMKHLKKIRRKLLAAALERAAFEGWNAQLLEHAEKDAGLDPGSAALACPKGVVDLLDFWSREADEVTAKALDALDLASMRIRDRVRAGVLARLDAIGLQNREAARRAAVRLALPDAAPRASTMLWRSADTIWRGIGDTSTDGNFYSKRAILSGVLGSTMAVWFEGDEEEKTHAFLDRRIENVMAFEKTKAKVRKFGERLPDPLGVLARVRFGR